MIETEWRVPGYEENRELGKGSQGRVVLAEREIDGELVAIKYLAPDALETTEGAQFRQEAQILASLETPYIAKLHEFMESPDGSAAIVMEYVPGATLRKVLDSSPEGLKPQSALLILKGSLQGLSAAHSRGLVHRDYKPRNILVSDETGESKLIDFGIAVLAGESGRIGTPAYMAPEQWRGGPASPATDVYAATCVFFECVTGHRPYTTRTTRSGTGTLEAQHTRARIPTRRIPRPLRSLVTVGMAKTPASRPTDADAFLERLEIVATAAYGPDWEKVGRAGLRIAAAAAIMSMPILAPHVVASIAAQGAKTGTKAKAAAASVAGITVAAAVIVALQYGGPAITHAEAREVIRRYVAITNSAARTLDTGRLGQVQAGPEYEINSAYFAFNRKYGLGPAGKVQIQNAELLIPREPVNARKWFAVRAGKGSVTPWIYHGGMLTDNPRPGLSRTFEGETMIFALQPDGAWKSVLTAGAPKTGDFPDIPRDEDGYVEEVRDADPAFAMQPRAIPAEAAAETNKTRFGEGRCTTRRNQPKNPTPVPASSQTGWTHVVKRTPSGHPVYALRAEKSAVVWIAVRAKTTSTKTSKASGWKFGPGFAGLQQTDQMFKRSLITDMYYTNVINDPAKPSTDKPADIGCAVGLLSYTGT
ncbi:serine/threonine protein kinase [Actinocorallia sp. API 0066]|uniref:serine/threonine-protein kinase n=1 Tax=Actinocorallia sp. API 0066 TaxID=2896846 RepID=UPI001E6491EB|nr:serine/threonine-protein kinase [Actinocorallia sp. API 0066]MCD0449654.1 serine/threonine protein kinase [Actinocorallia sp. API 0066]